LQRIEATFKSAILNELRERASPTIGVADHLGPHERNIGCHAAMPYTAVPAFLVRLREGDKSSAARLALEFLILTACRSQEVRGTSWAEINLDQAVWSIPAARLKTRRRRRHPHVVPLGPRCLEILVDARALNPKADLVFPGAKRGERLSDNTFVKTMRDMGVAEATAHGFRSAFKDWCAEIARVRDEVSEAALSHCVNGKASAAYLRTDFLSERVAVMRQWDSWLRSDPHPPADAKIHDSSTGITV
jgi:integrase